MPQGLIKVHIISILTLFLMILIVSLCSLFNFILFLGQNLDVVSYKLLVLFYNLNWSFTSIIHINIWWKPLLHGLLEWNSNSDWRAMPKALIKLHLSFVIAFIIYTVLREFVWFWEERRKTKHTTFFLIWF